MDNDHDTGKGAEFVSKSYLHSIPIKDTLKIIFAPGDVTSPGVSFIPGSGKIPVLFFARPHFAVKY